MYKHEYEIVFTSGYRIQKSLLEDLDDIKRFYYERKYYRSYDSLGRYLEEGAEIYLKHIEELWMHNKLDTAGIYKEPDIYMYHAQKVADDMNFQDEGFYDEEDDETYYEDYEVSEVIVLR